MFNRQEKMTMGPQTSIYPHGFSAKLALLHLASFGWILGIFILWGLTSLIPVYFSLAYVVLIWALLLAVRSSHDWLNPLNIILYLGFIRFSLPGFMTMAGMESGVRMFDLMGIQSNDWLLGHVLAVMGLLGVVTGWLLNLRLPESVIRRIQILANPVTGGLPVAAIGCMLLGLTALVLFVSSNASFEDAIYSGEMRGTEIQQGTGKYFRISLMLISSSVVFTTYLANSGRAWWVAMLPSMFASACFVILGGRSLAAAPAAAAWLALWCRNHASKRSMKLILLLGIAFLPVYSYLGQVYRGGLGAAGVKEELVSLSSIIQYLEYSVWVDWGHLHSIAAATMIGPGVLGGKTFTILLWPLSKILGLPARSAGVYMVDELLPFYAVSRGKWGFHATLIGDAYLNFGAIGVVIATIIFGALLGIIYVQIRQRLSNTAFYGLATISCVQLFYISIESLADVIMVFTLGIFVVQLSRLFTFRLSAALNPHMGEGTNAT